LNAPVSGTWTTDTPASWQQAVDSWPWRRIGPKEWKKSGSCPSCAHPMSVNLEAGFIAKMVGPSGVALGRRAGGERMQPPSQPVEASCNCSEPHSQRPDAIKFGCGRLATISPPERDG
jgi:hypothetical protein